MAVGHDADMSRLGILGGALGDGTRFSIYTHVIDTAGPISAGETAEHFGLHRTVARSHLEKLVQAGLLTVATRRNPGGGRPAKVYSPSSERLEIQIPPRRYESLSHMLLRMMATMNGRSVPTALQAGFEFGRELSGALSPDERRDGHADVPAIVRFLDERGYRPTLVEDRGGRIVLEVGNCAFLEVAETSPEIVCSLSSGLLCGLFGVPTSSHTHSKSILAGDRFCRHEFTLQD